jgi:hypothetical protein
VYANDAYGTQLKLQPTFHEAVSKSTKVPLRRIRSDLDRGMPVAVNLSGHLNHFTVVAGYSDTRLYLFDSSGFRWVHTSSIGVGWESGRTHWICPSSTVTLFDDW